MWRTDERLLIQVWDDGHGGASLDGGTGMSGLADRLGAVDGLFVIDSPPGGPTVDHGGAAVAGPGPGPGIGAETRPGHQARDQARRDEPARWPSR